MPVLRTVTRYRPGMITRRAIAVAALVLPLTACGTGGARTYDSVESLRDAVIDAGVGCSAFEPLSERQGMCGSGLILIVWDNTEDREAFAEVVVGQGVISSTVLSGGNWVITGDRGDLEAIQDELGGAIEDTSD